MTELALATVTAVGAGRTATPTTFLVNPASANGSTGGAGRSSPAAPPPPGSRATRCLSERPGDLSELAREAALGGARLLVVVGGDGSVNEVANGLVGARRPAGDRASSPAARAGTSSARSGSRATSSKAAASRARRRDAHDRPRSRVLPRVGRGERDRRLRERRERRDERRDRQARERDDEGARREGVATCGRRSPSSRAGRRPRSSSPSTTSGARDACSTSSSRTAASSAAGCRSAPRPSPTTASSTCSRSAT